MSKDEIKARMKHLARKFCRRNDVYGSFDSSVGKLIEKAYLSAYFLCLHEGKHKITKLEKDNAELKSIADFQTSSNMNRYFQLKRSKERLSKAKELLLELYDCIPSSMADSCKETLQKVALFFKDSEVSE